MHPCHHTTGRFLAARVTLALVAIGLLGCTGTAPEPAPAPRGADPAPLLLIGIDGLEWDVMLPLLHAGELPTFRRLMEHGVYGRLGSIQPTLSPVIWTTIATGKEPADHGILAFAYEAQGQSRLFTNLHRTAAAFWNLLSDADQTVHVVGWWMTFPVDPVNGVMVAQTNTVQQADAEARRAGKLIIKGSVLPGVEGQVHPPELAPLVLRATEDVIDSMPDRLASIFDPLPTATTPLEERLWPASLWSFRADSIYLELSRLLLERSSEFDVMALYLGGTDIVGHRFWRYRDPEPFRHPPSVEEVERWGSIIDDYYRHLDRRIGTLLELLPERAGVLILSDHGMHADNLDEWYRADDPPNRIASGHHNDAPPGVLIAHGYPFRDSGSMIDARRGTDLPLVGDVYDILPTLLALKGVRIAEDLSGGVMEELLRPGVVAQLEIVRGSGVDFTEWRDRRVERELTPEAEQERLEQLRALGYIE